MNDDALWETFSRHALSATEWTHEAHLRVAYLHVTRYALDEAHLRMRAGIIRMNERHGLTESVERGYFETLTRVWLVLVLDATRRASVERSMDLLASCPELLDRKLPLRHYSAELLRTANARAIFLAPDRSPLPDV
jgi:hypothetical protein